MVTDATEVFRQKLWNRFRLFRGEWFADPEQGVPYFQAIFGQKQPDEGVVTTILTEVIEDCPGFAELLSLEYRFDSSTREAFWTFRARCLSGGVVSGGNKEPFIVEAA